MTKINANTDIVTDITSNFKDISHRSLTLCQQGKSSHSAFTIEILKLNLYNVKVWWDPCHLPWSQVLLCVSLSTRLPRLPIIKGNSQNWEDQNLNGQYVLSGKCRRKCIYMNINTTPPRWERAHPIINSRKITASVANQKPCTYATHFIWSNVKY